MMRIQVITTRIYPVSPEDQFKWVTEIDILDAKLFQQKDHVLLVLLKILEGGI